MWMWMKKWIVNGVNKFMSWRNHIFESKCQNREGKIIAQKCLDLKYIDRKVYLCKKWTPLQKLIILILFTFERIDFSEWFNREGIWFSNANLKRQKSESTYLVCLIIATTFFWLYSVMQNTRDFTVKYKYLWIYQGKYSFLFLPGYLF